MIEKKILKALQKLDKKINELPEPSSDKEAQKLIEALTDTLETLERLDKKLTETNH